MLPLEAATDSSDSRDATAAAAAATGGSGGGKSVGNESESPPAAGSRVDDFDSVLVGGCWVCWDIGMGEN